MQLDRQRALSELGIPEELYNELLQLFMEEAGQKIKSLEDLVFSADSVEIARAAHFIKGSAGNLRIDEIQALAKTIEFAAKENKDIKIIEEGFSKLKAAFEDLKKIIPQKQ